VQVADAQPTDADGVATELSLECHYEDGMANGFFYLQTMRVEIEDLGVMWMPTDFYGYLAEPELEGHASAALDRMAATFVVNGVMEPQQADAVNKGSAPSNNVDTPVNTSESGDYDPEAFLQAQQELYQ